MRRLIPIGLLLIVSACAQKNLLEPEFATETVAPAEPKAATENTVSAARDGLTPAGSSTGKPGAPAQAGQPVALAARTGSPPKALQNTQPIATKQTSSPPDGSHTRVPPAVDFHACLARGANDGIIMTTLAHYLLGEAKSGQRINVSPAMMADYARLVINEVDLRGTTTEDVVARHKKLDKACFSVAMKRGSAKAAKVASQERPGTNKESAAASGAIEDSYRKALGLIDKFYGQIETIMKKSGPDKLSEHVARNFLPVTVVAPISMTQARRLP